MYMYQKCDIHTLPAQLLAGMLTMHFVTIFMIENGTNNNKSYESSNFCVKLGGDGTVIHSNMYK